MANNIGRRTHVTLDLAQALTLVVMLRYRCRKKINITRAKFYAAHPNPSQIPNM